MTILGAMLADQETAVIWVDSETFRHGEPSGDKVCKLAINSQGGVCGAGCGLGYLAMAGDRAVLSRGADLDAVVTAMPGVLREASPRAVKGQRDPNVFSLCSYLVAGWSNEFSRMVIYEFPASSFFVPRVAAFATLPCVGDLWPRPIDEEAVLAVARQQLGILQTEYPAAIGGDLTIAVLTPGNIHVRVHRDFSIQQHQTQQLQAAA